VGKTDDANSLDLGVRDSVDTAVYCMSHRGMRQMEAEMLDGLRNCLRPKPSPGLWKTITDAFGGWF
jgi:hypothetical protein